MIPVILIEYIRNINNGTVCIFRMRLLFLLSYPFANVRLVLHIGVVLWLPSLNSWLTALPHVFLDILIQIEKILLDLKLFANLKCQLHILLYLQLLLLLLNKLLKLAGGPLRFRTLLRVGSGWLLGTVVLRIHHGLVGWQVVLVTDSLHVVVVEAAHGGACTLLILTSMLLLELQFDLRLFVMALRGVDPYTIVSNFTFDLVRQLINLIDKAAWFATHLLDKIFRGVRYLFLLGSWHISASV